MKIALVRLAGLVAVLVSSVAQAGELIVNPALEGASDENTGAEAQPLKTIARAAAKARAGDTIRIHTGVYREQVVVEQSGTEARPIRFEAVPGAAVVVTGADSLTDWHKADAAPGENVYSTAWPHRFIGWSKTGTHPSDDYHRLVGRVEQVFINGYPLQQVLSADRLSRGTFYVDLDGKRLQVQASSNARLDGDRERVEASVRSQLWDVQGDHVHIAGLVFRYGAAPAQHALVTLHGRGDVVEDCTFEGSNGNGASFQGTDQVARRCTFQDNGQGGFTAVHAHNLLMSECVTRNNNTKNFNRGWEAGGCKVVLSRGVVIERSQFVKNRGNGIWFDIGNEQAAVRNCLVADNEDAGIFYEISYGLHAHDNVIVGNGFLSGPGAWGANGGIALSSSPHCVVERNLIVGNQEGFQFREQGRTTARIEQKAGTPEEWVWNHDQVVRNNVLALNCDAQVWGWFDIHDERHWPARLHAEQPPRQSAPADDLAAAYKTRKNDGAPAGLTLEKLGLAFERNLYVTTPPQGLFHWGPRWTRHTYYKTLDEVRADLNLESGMQVAALKFVNAPARDFRLPADSPALKLGCYPHGDVPGVRLGIAER